MLIGLNLLSTNKYKPFYLLDVAICPQGGRHVTDKQTDCEQEKQHKLELNWEWNFIIQLQAIVF